MFPNADNVTKPNASAESEKDVTVLLHAFDVYIEREHDERPRIIQVAQDERDSSNDTIGAHHVAVCEGLADRPEDPRRRPSDRLAERLRGCLTVVGRGAIVRPMSMFNATVPQFSKMLTNLQGWLDKAVAHAEQKGFEPGVLLTSRLAPDQFHLIRQVQSACDTAKFAAARLTGNEPPSHPDTEQTLDEVQARIKTVLDYLGGFEAAAFEGSADRLIVLPFLPGKTVVGKHYLNQFVLPNFYFHVTTAYAILRHNGVDLGKRDFLGSMPLMDAKPEE